MGRMFDRIKARGLRPMVYPEQSERLRDQSVRMSKKYLDGLGIATVVDCSQVARYYFEGTDRDFSNWRQDFPNIAPAFGNVAWLECKRPAYGFTPDGSQFDLAQHYPYSWGALMITSEHPPNDEVEKMIRSATKDEIKWWTLAALYLEFNKCDTVGPVALTTIPIGPSGMLPTKGDDSKEPAICIYLFDEEIRPLDIDLALRPLMLALTFAHTKGVVVKDGEVQAKVAKRHRKKTGHELTPYKVIDIAPVVGERSASRPGDYERNSKGEILFRRGHHKTYTEDGKLFGKYTGTYWWDQVAKDIDRVKRDYRIGESA